MKPFNIVLVEPEIPQNTGNISRTCACTGAALHLVKPLGFSIDEKHVRRAGLDYWDALDLTVHESLEDFLAYANGYPMFFATTKAEHRYTDVAFPTPCFLLFGKETAGLPVSLLKDHRETCIRIPMLEQMRSLNLSNSVAVVLYEAMRQHGFSHLQGESDVLKGDG